MVAGNVGRDVLTALAEQMLPAVEVELRRNVETAGQAELAGLRQMLAYHMGWEGEGAGPEASGKRIRPLLVLLCCAAAGGDWTHALPAAAAVELVHNFSLIHDDIQDNSDRRRGRLTVWKLWGVPQAINSGDTMFTLAHLAVLRLAETAAPEVVLQAAQWLQETCLHLTQGQYLDISYEHRHDLALTDYWPMVEGKTAALLSTCTRLGALVAGAAPARLEAYRQFGRWLGLAFQAQDDLLGIWGDADLTGKSAASDLLTGKKSLPVLYGLGLRGAFANRWAQGPIAAAEVPALAAQLAEEGGRAYTQEAADRLTNDALQALAQAGPTGEAGVALTSLAKKLLNRNV